MTGGQLQGKLKVAKAPAPAGRFGLRLRGPQKGPTKGSTRVSKDPEHPCREGSKEQPGVQTLGVGGGKGDPDKKQAGGWEMNRPCWMTLRL